ncbi:TonB-dependent receptor [Oceaniserpentilla sp. 4NH20-0058]|uniref:TonB-dependent receptor n=1 Tax=Oceaniserpentilla sp. 4NH20-0058 TaxID=3127660 RepID=UPI00310BCE71
MSSNNKKSLTLRKSRLAPSAAITIGLPTLLFGAIQTATAEDAIVLDPLQVEERTVDTNPYAEPGAPYKAKVSGDSRHVKDLADTPQTITVLTQTQIQESGRSDLKEILDAQPGITLGTGENGNAFGDRYVIRGHEARSDVFVDGLRDPGMTTRESFAVEQVEITKGPSSTFAGRGSSGGAVNSITKQASTEYDFNKVEAGLGTDSYRRIALDSNQTVSEDLAVRANIMHTYKEVPDRGPNDMERNGVALSATYQASDKLKIIGDYYHLTAFDRNDLGSYIDSTSGNVNHDVPAYAQEQDFLKSNVDTVTLRALYEVNSHIRLENATRFGTTDNGYVVTGARGRTRDASDPAGAIDTISLSTHQGWQEVEYFANQLNMLVDTELAGMKHQFVFGSEYSQHNVVNGVYNVTNNGTTNCAMPGRGSNPASQSYCIVDASGEYVDDLGSLMGRSITKGNKDSDYSIDTLSVYAMDTVELSNSLSLFAGVRADTFKYKNIVTNRDSTISEYKYDDVLWNGHVGGVYKITDNSNVYVTYSTAANINGGESDVGGSCGYGGICSSTENVDKAKPESVENIEVGTKWNVLNNKLLATAALFQITKDDVMEGTDYDTDGTYNTGKNRVKGIELSLVGNITDRLSTQLGVSIMESEILEANDAEDEGGILANFADQSAYAQVRYQLTDEFSFGAAVNYSSEVFVGQPDSAANEERGVPEYTVFDAFASYEFNERLNARLNIANLTDKNYYLTAYRSGGFAYIGDARNAKLTLSYEF